MNEEMKERNDPEIPALLVGKYRYEIHTGTQVKPPIEIKQTQTSPLVAFLNNKSYEKKKKEKGPSADPLPFPW